jgi:ComF family protein
MTHPLQHSLRTARRRLGAWLDHLAPRACALCCETLAPGAFPGLCAGCLLALPGARRPRCAACGLAIGDASAPAAPADASPPGAPAAAGIPAATVPAGRCGHCARSIAVDLTLAAADYAPPLDRAITAMKFGRQLGLARPLGELLAARWLGGATRARLDCLVPVPLGDARLAERGFNQSLEMARAMSAALASPLQVHARRLLRLRETPAQAGLGLAARRINLRGCFGTQGSFAGLHVGLVDDVMTTGSTLAEAAATLKRAGAERVVALVVARTP